MAGYTRARTNWLDWPNMSTPIQAVHLNKWDQAIADLKGLAFNPMDYAATGDGTTDDAAAISAAVTAAKAANGCVILEKNHAYGSALSIDSVPVIGLGAGAKLTALDPANSQVNLIGTGAELHDLTITCPTASTRLNTDLAMGVVVNASAFTLRNVVVDKVESVGYKFTGASRGKIIGCAARNTFADGFHVTGASSYLQFLGCEGYLTGDDSFAVVSVTTDSAAVSYIEWVGCISISSSTSGFRVSGGTHIGVRGGSVKSPAGSGLAIEVLSGATTTYGNYDTVADGVLIDSPGGSVNTAGVIVTGIDATHLCQYTTLRDVTVKNSQSGNHASIEIGAYAYDVTVDGKVLTAGQYGISVGIGGSGGPPRDVRINGCTIDSPVLSGVYVDYCAGMLEIKDNVFRNIDTGNTIGPAVTQFTANATSRNVFTGNQHLGSKVANLSNLLFASSLIVDTRGNYSESGCTISTGGAASGEIGYTAITGTVNVTANTSATANTIVTAPAYAFDGITPVLIEADFSSYDKGTTYIVFVLYDGATELGQWGFNTGLKGSPDHAHLEYRLTPSAATHTYSIRAFVDAGTGHVYAGSGAAGAEMPSFIRLTIPSPPY